MKLCRYFFRRFGLKQENISAFFFTAILIGYSQCLLGAPMPATSTSEFYKINRIKFVYKSIFMLQASNQNWELTNESSDDLKLQPIFPKNASDVPTVSVQLDHLDKPLSLEAYAKKWSKSYLTYGFDILATTVFDHQGSKALMMDLNHKTKSKRIKQIIYMAASAKKAAILTCASNTEEFKDLTQDCDAFTKSFAWINKQ